MTKVRVLAKEIACVITLAGYEAEGCLKGFEFADAKRVFLRGFKKDNGFGVLCRVGFIVVGYIFGNVGCPAAGLSMRTPSWRFSGQRAYPGWEIMMRSIRR